MLKSKQNRAMVVIFGVDQKLRSFWKGEYHTRQSNQKNQKETKQNKTKQNKTKNKETGIDKYYHSRG